MILVSQNLSNYEMSIPKNSVFRINLAWVNNIEQLKINEINAGIYVFDNEMLLSYITKIDNHNAQNEFYLPDIINIMKQNGHHTAIYKTPNINDIKGINNKEQLIELSHHLIENEKK